MTESADDEASVQCPYCGEWQSVVLDPESIGEPWQMTVRRSSGGKLAVRVTRM